MKCFCLVFALFIFSFPVRAELTRTFLKTHCIKCHGPQKQKAQRRFDQLPSTITKIEELEVWQEFLAQLNLSDMPT